MVVFQIQAFCMAFRVVLITTMVRNFRSSLWVEQGTGREDLAFSMECGTVLICDVSSLLLVAVGLLCPIHTTPLMKSPPFQQTLSTLSLQRHFLDGDLKRILNDGLLQGIGCKISATNFHILGGYYFVTSFYDLNSDLLACRGRNCEINRLYIEAVLKINGHSSCKESCI